MVAYPDSQPLLSVAAARTRLLDRFSKQPVEHLKLTQSGGRVLAETIYAGYDLPPFSNSSMDGFAVRAADIEQARPEAPVHLRVVADIPAGTEIEQIVRSGEAIRIMTGAPLPSGADTVVPVENTDFNERSAGTLAPEAVAVYRPEKVGENTRPRGEDVRAGEAVLHAGS
ncbi:MAG TPA: hypothetical protein VN363_03890, partial [Anaerolineales bacterium]|nr:hypothetical protein [Anaerolineales bacterium]